MKINIQACIHWWVPIEFSNVCVCNYSVLYLLSSLSIPGTMGGGLLSLLLENWVTSFCRLCKYTHICSLHR